MYYLYSRYKKNKRLKEQQAASQAQRPVDEASASNAEPKSASTDTATALGTGVGAAVPVADAATTTTTSVEGEKSSEPQKTPEELKAAKKAKWKWRMKLIFGLFFPFFINSLDTTVISVALPEIASAFNQLINQSYIVTTYTITSTCFIPVYAVFARVFGRHWSLQSAIFLLLVGNALCAGAQAFSMLLIGRCIAGIGSAGVLVMCFVILSDGVDLEENAKQNTLFALIAGISFSIGPVIGGYLTSANWRWCFGLTIPICLLAHVTILFLLRKHLTGPEPYKELDKDGNVVSERPQTFREKLAAVDYIGVVLFLGASVSLVIALSYGGSKFAWNSATTIGLFVGSGFMFGLFILAEWSAVHGKLNSFWPRINPMIPLTVFREKDFCILTVIKFSAGMGIYSMFYFLSLTLTIVNNLPSSQAGAKLLFFLPGLGVGSYSAMAMCNLWPRQTFPGIFIGCISLSIAFGLLSHAIVVGPDAYIYGMMAFAGFGMALTFMPVTLHGIARLPKQIPVVVSVLQFSQPFGGTVALAILGCTLNNEVAKVAKQIAESKTPIAANLGHSIDSINALPKDLQVLVRHAVREGVRVGFLAIMAFAVLSAALCFLLGNVFIKRPDQEGLGQKDASGRRRDRPALLRLIEKRHKVDTTTA